MVLKSRKGLKSLPLLKKVASNVSKQGGEQRTSMLTTTFPVLTMVHCHGSVEKSPEDSRRQATCICYNLDFLPFMPNLNPLSVYDISGLSYFSVLTRPFAEKFPILSTLVS